MIGPKRLMSYDFIIVAFSGGKDSMACVLRLLAMGIPAITILN
jgi:tRNA(Ile)-lysidine synthase TilS/MesJ